ncbi:PTS sugar transporter subunit IIA [Streptomyces rubiginosohelvolus]|uniref:PTS sugar transporter subunit IIA n=1 Tax=Streptomyces rubiginosohelvolus TaxID=67362 RepID=UPI00343A2773
MANEIDGAKIAESLTYAAARVGLTVKVEVRHSRGVNDPLTDREIADAKAVVIVSGQKVGIDRFGGKPLMVSPVGSAFREPGSLMRHVSCALRGPGDPVPATGEALPDRICETWRSEIRGLFQRAVTVPTLVSLSGVAVVLSSFALLMIIVPSWGPTAVAISGFGCFSLLLMGVLILMMIGNQLTEKIDPKSTSSRSVHFLPNSGEINWSTQASVFPEGDVDEIREVLLAIPPQSSHEETESYGSIAEYLNASAIQLNLASVNRKAAISELVEILHKAGYVTEPRKVMAALDQFSGAVETAPIKGFAFSRGAVEGVTSPVVAYGRSVPGVDWQARDGMHVHDVFLILTPARSFIRNEHFRIFVRLIRKLANPAIRSRLRDAKSPVSVVDSLRGDAQ